MNSYKSKKLIDKKRQAYQTKKIVFSFLFLVVIAGFFYWMRQPSVNISDVQISGTRFIDPNTVQAQVINSISGDMLYLIPKKNSIFIPRKQIVENLKTEFLSIEDVNIDLQNLDSVAVKVEEYEPKMVWSVVGDKNYFVNESGNIFLEEPLLNQYTLVKIISENKDAKIGDSVINKDFLSSINNFVESLKKLSIVVEEIKMDKNRVYHFKTNSGFEILVTESNDLKISFENIQSIFDNNAIDKNNLSGVDYLDLRFGNKVFYKMR